MPIEVFWLVLVAAYTSLLFIPYAIVRVGEIGFARAVVSPPPGDAPFAQPWAHRAYRAHMNAFEALAVFAPVTLGLAVAGISNEVTQTAAAAYFFARLVHAPIYILKIPLLRTPAFLVGLAATLTMAWQYLSYADWPLFMGPGL